MKSINFSSIIRENLHRRILLDYTGWTRISCRYMRTLTQTNVRTCGDSHERIPNTNVRC